MKFTECQKNRLRDIIYEYNLRKYALTASENDGEMYIRTFLIDDTRNSNGWRVSWPSIKQKAKNFIGKPGIEYTKCGIKGCMLDHITKETYNKSIHAQENHRVTTIRGIDFDDNTHTAYAIHRVDDASFGKLIKEGQIKYLSPAIWPDKERSRVTKNTETNEWHIDTTDWKGLHTAFVDNPAYGPKAVVHGICNGTEGECKHEFGKVSPGSEGPGHIVK